MFGFRKNNVVAQDNLPEIFKAALGESPHQAMQLANEWHQHRKIVRALWSETAAASLASSIQRANEIIMEDEDLLASFMNLQSNMNRPQGLVLLTIHMGDYLHSVMKIVQMAHNRKILILRRKAWSAEEQASFAKLRINGHEVTTVRQDPTAAKTIASALRKGAIAVLLYDLSSRWGETAPVKLFNNQMRWVSGPLTLAMLGKSYLIPFFCHLECGKSYCQLHSIRNYAGARPGLTRAEQFSTEMQSLTNLAEANIRKYASQWNHWHLIPEMIEPGCLQDNSIVQESRWRP